MKNFKLFIGSFLFLSLFSCKMDLENPNAATEVQVLSTKDGLFALATGIQQVYSTSALEPVLLTPSVSTRETAIQTTFANLEELETGGERLSGENGYTERLFTRLMRTKGMSEELIASVDNIDLSDQVKANIKSWGQLFRAISLGYLANNFEQVALLNGDDAVYSDRIAAYEEAITILKDNVSEMNTYGVSQEFNSSVGSSIDLLQASLLYLARFYLYTGQYDLAIATANEIDKTSVSMFRFDNQNPNPVYQSMFVGTVSYAPRDNFGLPESEFTIDPLDQRISFFLGDNQALSLNNLPISNMVCPFFITNTSEIPVYVPGEIDLILSESYARKNDVTNAEKYLNALRMKTPTEDALGIGAGLTDTFTSGNDVDVLLQEIYKNRRIELFLTGNSLEDSRRFNRPEAVEGYTSERNRDFYPYPPEERRNNPNTPPNPRI